MDRPLGPIRIIDDIGRVVIPVSIREALGWRTGDAVEVLADGEGRVVLRRYFPLSAGAGVVVVDVLHDITGAAVFLADTDDVLLVKGEQRPVYFPRFLSRAITARDLYREPDSHAIGCPIVRGDEVVGALGLRATFTLEKKHEYLLRFACEFLGRYRG